MLAFVTVGNLERYTDHERRLAHSAAVYNAVDVKQDVDGIHYVGQCGIGNARTYAPVTALLAAALLTEHSVALESKRFLVVRQIPVVGAPIAHPSLLFVLTCLYLVRAKPARPFHNIIHIVSENNARITYSDTFLSIDTSRKTILNATIDTL